MPGLHAFPQLPSPLNWPTYGNDSPAHEYVGVATAMQGLLNWPDGFIDFLGRYSQRDGRQYTTSIKSSFEYLFSGTLANWLERPEYEFVTRVFNDYVATHYTNGITKRYVEFRNNPIPADRFHWLLISEAAELLKVTERTIKVLINAGLLSLKPETKTYGKNLFLLKM